MSPWYLDTNVELLRDPSPLFWDTVGVGRGLHSSTSELNLSRF